MNIEELVVIQVEAEGYYSNSYIRCEVVVEKAFVEGYIDSFSTVYFLGLDGKHSEIVGDVTTIPITKENLRVIIESYLSSNGDEYTIWEQLLDGIPEQDVTRQIAVNSEFCKLVDEKVETTYYFKGERL